MSPTRITFIAVATSFTAVASLQSLIIPVLSTIGADLGADAVGQTWMLTAWLISAAVATPLLGRAGDLVGRRRMYLLALGAVAVGSVLAAFAPNLTVMLLARVLQGLGGAVFPLGFGLVRDAFPPPGSPAPSARSRRSWPSAAASAPSSPVRSRRPSAGAGCSRCRSCSPPPASCSASAASSDPPRAPPAGINVAAAVLLSSWLVALLLPLSSGNQWGWTSPMVLGLFAVAAVLATAWVMVEVRSRTPLVDMRMMRLPAVWTTNLTALLTGASMFGVWAYLPRLAETPTAAATAWASTRAPPGSSCCRCS